MLKHYHAYLLRMWQIDDAGQAAWRATLEDPATRQVIGFSSLESLCAYILEKKDEPDGLGAPSRSMKETLSKP